MKPSDHVINVELNRPEKMNAMNNVMWGEIGQVFRTIDKVNYFSMNFTNYGNCMLFEQMLKNMKFAFTFNNCNLLSEQKIFSDFTGTC